jgi:hypothetical protein
MFESEFLSLRFAADEQESFDPHRLRVVLIGTPEDVMRSIQDLHARGFAETRQWSILQPIPNSREVLSVMVKRGISPRESRSRRVDRGKGQRLDRPSDQQRNSLESRHALRALRLRQGAFLHCSLPPAVWQFSAVGSRLGVSQWLK